MRVCDGSPAHWRVGVIKAIYAYLDTGNHLVLLDGEDECCGYSAHDLELIVPEPEPKSEFKVGDRVEVSNSNDFHYGCAGVIERIERYLYVVALVDGLSDTYLANELRHLPTKPSRGRNPKSLKNLRPRKGRGECKEVHLRLPLGARDWLLRQGKGRMSAVVSELIMERMEKEEKES